MRQHKISVCKIVRRWRSGGQVRSKDFWRVIWWEGLTRKRRFFDSAAEAEHEASLLRLRASGLNEDWLALSQSQRDRVVLAAKEAMARGLDLLALVVNAPAAGQVAAPGFEAVFDELIASKTQAGRSEDYRLALKYTCRKFARGREALPVDRFSAADCEIFINSKNPASRATTRGRLSTFFKFCVRKKYRVDNPCYGLEMVKVLKKLPVVMTPEEAETAIKWFRVQGSGLPVEYPNIKWLGWFILTAFAGLRPEEAMKISSDELRVSIGHKKPFIEVKPGMSKTGQWRIIYPLPIVARALRWALKNGAVLPLTRNGKVKFQITLRAAIGWARWPKDVTRHSAASAWLALTNDQKHVTEMLGHSEAIFRAHYKKPMQRAVAQKYFAALKLVADK